MSDATKKEEPKAPEAPKLAYKFNGKEVQLDLSKPENLERLKVLAELGSFAEQRTASIKEQERALEQERSKLAADAQVGREFQAFLRDYPEQGAVIRQLYQGLREGVLDPSQIRAALTASKDGDTTALEAQARAAADPEARALLRETAGALKTLQTEIEGIKTGQARREQDAEIKAAVASIDFLRGRELGQKFVLEKTRQLVASGMPADLAATQASAEYKEVLSETATAERDRLRSQQELATAKPANGVAPISEYQKKAVDPKGTKAEQKAQRRAANLSFFQSLQRQAEEARRG